MEQGWLKKLGVSIPLVQEPHALKGSFTFLPPSSISIVGSHAIGCSLGPQLNVDISIEMPSVCIMKWISMYSMPCSNNFGANNYNYLFFLFIFRNVFKAVII